MWEELDKRDYTQPLKSKHATVLPITRAEMDKLIAHWGKPEWNRLKCYSNGDLLVRHANFKGMVSAYPFDPYQDSMWKVVPGLADERGVAFESVNLSGHFLRRDGAEVVLAKNDGSDAFKASATFIKEPGLADANWSSFRAGDAVGQYLRHLKGVLRVEAVVSPADKEDATFRLDY